MGFIVYVCFSVKFFPVMGNWIFIAKGYVCRGVEDLDPIKKSYCRWNSGS